MEGSINAKVDPTACIPFACMRKTTEAGIRRFIHNFDNNSTKDDENHILTSGYIVGSKLSVVVPLTGTLFQYVITYLKDTLKVDSLAAEKAAEKHDK